MNAILFAGHTGHRFFPFAAASIDEAVAVAEGKNWFVDDVDFDADGVLIISVIPRSMANLAPVIPLR